MDLILKLNETDGYVLPNPSTYRTLVEKLLYLVITRHDLSFNTQALTQYSHNPRSSHYDALIRVLRYIKVCPGQGLFFPVNNPLYLTTYYDSDSPVVLLLEGSIPINRDLIQAIPRSLPPQPIGEATKASNLQRIPLGVQARSHFTYFLYLIV
ncbi:uncharacterized mitochondrial protein-like protein [Tanacetum coccineum]